MALPYISVGYGIDRLYAMVSIVLAVFYIIGAMVISKKLKTKPWIIILIVLIPYFLSITGVTYNLLGYPRSIILETKGEEYSRYFINDQESYGAKWLSHQIQNNMYGIYTDYIGNLRLISQGLVNIGVIDSSSLVNNKKINGYIYLRSDNIVNKRLAGENYGIYHDIKNYSDYFKNEIYNNGKSEIYVVDTK